ncbi:DUF4166 domain-containing protein [Sphaerisporangium sp. TRM90804]|uniref:DUF4166 domain-containing protein n=1 Tax=Sphaerisporangium sp. TRM90804 TaxID=3031113 RepID=UPI002447BDE4|nr:DUF4166 domain-containing protein [Sphaerisporangium sp. TRM90804]MDH2426882.1 DUF4166 domain-containing protein [Sphaerisporangium sp. TRM90804]
MDDTPYDWMYRFHLGGETAAGAGSLTVRRGRGLLARLACAALRLPRAGERLPARVTVHRRAGTQPARAAAARDAPGPAPVVETWVRHIGPHRLTTTQVRAGEHGRERHGPLELRTRTAATGAEVTVTQEQALLGAGRWSLRLPARLAPRVAARAWLDPADAALRPPRFHIEVRVTAPVAGMLLSYSGFLRREPGG